MADKVKERERIKRCREKKKSTMNKEELYLQRKYETERKRAQRAKKKEIERSTKCQDMIISEEQPLTSMLTLNCKECGVDAWVNPVINFDENDREEDMETNFYQWKRIEGKMKKELIARTGRC
ncbi:hypothetical protein AVEN_219764-1 [Araneus ventricosus]|uniref:Uncharacterized protein n=1 Tax=Araneus ventricosus TaxID=182803 RepID=A0A4Y2JUI3_ARAVE|nr:hypothetical protein AVEN_219764-1 [Araneus ventricosus]